MRAKGAVCRKAKFIRDFNRAVADREGFEPSVGFHLHTLSKRARSTTPPPVRFTLRLARRRRSIRREAGLIEHTRPLGKRLSHPHMDFNAIFR